MFDALSEHLTLGTSRTHGGLTLTPILRRRKDAVDPAPQPLSLEEALARKQVTIEEVSTGGSVPELRLRNHGEEPVLVLDGEELVGAKQNRVVNVSILVPAKSDLVIPVSCIEAGRWSYTRPSFSAGGRVQNYSGRMSKAESVSRNLKASRSYASDQGRVWAEVDHVMASISAASPTRSLSDAYDSRAHDLEQFVKSFAPEQGQVGVIYTVQGRLAGLDLFGSAATLAKAFGKLVQGAALQAIAGLDASRAAAGDPAQFLQRALRTPGELYPAVGLGEDVRLASPGIGGGALRLNGDLVHLFAYPRPQADREDLAVA